MKWPIDRNDPEDVLIQKGYVMGKIEELGRKLSKHERELKIMDRRKEYLKQQKIHIAAKISKKHLYLNQLDEDLKRINNVDGDGTTRA